MVVHEFISAAGKMELLTHVGLDDCADRLNCLFTVCFLMVFSCATTIKTYFLNPIFCYLPNIVGSHEGQSAYVNNYCYTEGTYNVPLEQFRIDNANLNWDAEYRSKKIYYYQWLPFIIGVQGIMFCIPRFTWQLLASQRAGTDLFQLVRVASDAGRADGEKREKLKVHVTRQLELWLFNTRELSHSSMKQTKRRLYRFLSCCVPSKRLGTWLVFCYFVIKLVYIFNLLGQLLLMCHVLQVKSSRAANDSLLRLTSTFGLDLLSELISGRDWQHTGLFPRSGACAIKMRQTADAQFIFAQCALPVNMIHEKIFIFLWFWYVLVLALTLLSVALWCFRLLSHQRSRLFKKYLFLAEKLSHKSKDEHSAVDNFVVKFLRHDGALVLHMMALNCGDLITTEICADLYQEFKTQYSHLDLRGSPTDIGDAIAVNVSHSSIAAMSPGGTGCTKRRRRRSNSGNGADEKHNSRASVFFAEPSAPLMEEPAESVVRPSNGDASSTAL